MRILLLILLIIPAISFSQKKVVLNLGGSGGGSTAKVDSVTASNDSLFYWVNGSSTFVSELETGGGSYAAGNGIKIVGDEIKWADTIASTELNLNTNSSVFSLNGFNSASQILLQNQRVSLFANNPFLSGTYFNIELRSLDDIQQLLIDPGDNDDKGQIIIKHCCGGANYFQNRKDTLTIENYDIMVLGKTSGLVGAYDVKKIKRQQSGTPSSTSDTQGEAGDMLYDDNYIYIKTSAGWKRVSLSTF
jgi:hypothetical protein